MATATQMDMDTCSWSCRRAQGRPDASMGEAWPPRESRKASAASAALSLAEGPPARPSGSTADPGRGAERCAKRCAVCSLVFGGTYPAEPDAGADLGPAGLTNAPPEGLTPAQYDCVQRNAHQKERGGPEEKNLS